MREFWQQIRLPFIVICATTFAVGTVVGVAYAVYWLAMNREALGRFVSTRGEVIATIVAVVVGYFLPSVIAFFRKHHNFAPIFIVNGFSGIASLLFPVFLAPGIAVSIWVGALAWSLSASPVPIRPQGVSPGKPVAATQSNGAKLHKAKSHG